MMNSNLKSFLVKVGICIYVALMINLIPVSNIVNAQNVSVNVHAPIWAPHYNYPERVRYYYMPDIESYYDVNRGEYVYLQNGVWVYNPGLPPAYATYDIDNAYVVVLDYNVYNPWRYHNTYRSHYPRYYYRTVYKTKVINNTTIRGYNENEKNVVYSQPHPNKNKASGTNKSTEKNYPKNTGSTTIEKHAQEKPQQQRDLKPNNHDNTVGHPVPVKREAKQQQQKSGHQIKEHPKGSGNRK